MSVKWIVEYRFQSALPRGERRITVHDLGRRLYFNPRSREGSDVIRSQLLLRSRNFNPRSREGSDHRVVKRVNIVQISIRAPARGATVTLGIYTRGINISIRAPARGATCHTDHDQDRQLISIRAPARGATAVTRQLL